ncbi:alpha-hydroxy acid oxidase [Cupriavidus plantarum]|uniref:alpha-hydroxy acid oxidase n=1 Tax=Cupriavidus plantarum TaxID=942865 RepID=UPI001B26FE93|nr:alpha-hydroxy acid oxidase [Cupriavidus plantarum]CAG2127960.1 4-hydroxymandelate oxidase [Cupriavidus plantarum]SMR66862.1 4-hydroxymandelate oxidase [Cupriavidus plantarum]
MHIPPDTVSLRDYERRFHERVDAGIRGYIAGAAADGITQRENQAAFERIRLLPRVLADLSQATASRSLFGETLRHPILIAPTAYHKLVHPEGELAVARAASLTHTWMVVSTLASVTLEEIARASVASAAPLWFQLYVQPRAQDTFSLIGRAEQAGYRAIVVTVDAVVSGIRNVEQRAGFRLPDDVSAVNLAGFPANEPVVANDGSPVFRGLLRGAPTWTEIEAICRQTALPVILKGILNPCDVEPAIRAGASGIIVSNHGGRTLDTVPATIDCLAAVVAQVAGRVPVLLDGGVRRGTDIVKAIALGASAVLVGQPILHALAVGGLPGVAHMLTLLQTELEAAMALMGCPTLDAITVESIAAGRPG